MIIAAHSYISKATRLFFEPNLREKLKNGLLKAQVKLSVMLTVSFVCTVSFIHALDLCT